MNVRLILSLPSVRIDLNQESWEIMKLNTSQFEQ